MRYFKSMLHKDTNKPNIRFHHLGNFLRLLMKSNMDIIVQHSLTFVSKSKIKSNMDIILLHSLTFVSKSKIKGEITITHM